MPSVSQLQAQPPIAPLNPEAQQAIAALLDAQSSRKRLDGYLKDATKQLTEVAYQLNDRGSERQMRYEREVSRLAANGLEPDDEHQTDEQAFQAKVKTLTEKMDQNIQAVIDEQRWMEYVPDALRDVARKTASIAQATQQQTQGPTPLATQRTRRVIDDEDEDEEAEGAAESQALEIAPPDPSEAPTALLKAALQAHAKEWKSRSKTDRYTTDNDYVGFKRIVHDAQYQGQNAPPIPHASLWFAEEERLDGSTIPRSQLRRGNQARDDEDSDVEIAAERVSVKCPLTLLFFKNPVTSTKCPHSFEKAAIEEMLAGTEDFELTPEQQIEVNQIRSEQARKNKAKWIGIAYVKCPVCSTPLTQTDLRLDQVLKRKTERAQAAARQQEDAKSDSEDDGGAPRGTQRQPVGLGSSPARRASGRAQSVKKERARSMVPSTQFPSRTQTTVTAAGATVVDLGDEDEDGEDDEMQGA